MENLKRTPLHAWHSKNGATMVPFGGWDMPVQYTNVMDEHMTTRNAVALFDICHMGEFLVTGKGAQAFLQSMVTNDIDKLDEKQACYNCLCKEDGGVLDDLFVYKLKDGEFYVVVNAGTIDKDLNWLQDHAPDDVTIENQSDTTAKLDIQGPKSQEVLAKITDVNLDEIKRFRCEYGTVADVENVLISRTGYTGEDGFELYFPSDKAEHVWQALMDAGKEQGIKPAGLGARDTLRLEACYSLYGHELNEETTPIEAGLGFVVKLDTDFIGKGVMAKQKEEGPTKKFIAFEMVDRAIPREHYDITKDGEKIGEVSSGTFSPLFKKGIGMGFVKPAYSKVDTEVDISVRGKTYKARVAKRPLYVFRGGK